MTIEILKLINGNSKEFDIALPLICMQTKEMNDVALAHIFENTSLAFVKSGLGYQAQPTQSWQIAALFLTYNFKTKYYNNADFNNTLMLKFDHHTGFDVDSICYDCVKHNHIHTNGLEPESRLSC